MAIGGLALKWWVEVAAALSNMGLFEAEMSSDAFQLLGMGERGMLPEVFAKRSKYGTPVLGILCSATGVVLLSSLSFQEIVELLNYLYCFGMLLEFAGYIWLRIKKPDLPRPYKIPLGTTGVTIMCMAQSILLLVVMCITTARTVIFSFVIAIIGMFLHPALDYFKAKGWCKFAVSPKLLSDAEPAPRGVQQDSETAVHLLRKGQHTSRCWNMSSSCENAKRWDTDFRFP